MDVLVIGFALFSLFFGAGNLIFPPFLGKIYGSNCLLASLGFILTGVGLASLGLISMAKRNGDIKNFTHIAGQKLGDVTLLLIAMTIGPLGAIPRTGATSGEVMIEAGLSIPYILFIFIFFALTLIFIINDSKIIDIVGKYLTPILLFVLAFMIIAGIINPIGESQASDFTKTQTFTKSIIEGYNTMDALASVAFAPIIIKSLIDKGYKNNLIGKTLQVTMIAASGLIAVYISLSYLGASSSEVFSNISSRVGFLIAISNQILGPAGKYILSTIIVLACFTTSVGLTSSIAHMLCKIFDGKVSYKVTAVAITVVSVMLALIGVDGIIEFTLPILTFVYPVVLVMIIYNLFDINFASDFRLASFYLVAIISLLQAITSYIAMVDKNAAGSFSKIISWLPSYESGFPWLIPFLLVFVIGLIFARKDENISALA